MVRRPEPVYFPLSSIILMCFITEFTLHYITEVPVSIHVIADVLQVV